MPIGKRAAAEFFGTFWLVFGGCGAAVLAAGFPTVGIGFAGVALAFGLTVLTMAFAIGHISGCHLNPAISLGLVVGKRFPASDLLPYVIAQVVGAIAGAQVMKGLLVGVAPLDPVTFVGVAALLGLVALLACYVPVRRAMRVDPVLALRYE